MNTAIGLASAPAGVNGRQVADSVYRLVGRNATWNPFSSNYKTKIEAWAGTGGPNFSFPVAQNVSKYAGVNYGLWGSSDGGLTRVLAPTIRIGDVYIGADKLGHFMQQGYVYYILVTRHGHTLADARQWGHETEAAAPLNEVVHYTDPPLAIFGLQSTGVYSRADLEANSRGYEFYRWLENNPGGRFDIRDYVNANWNEETHTNLYHGDVAPVVWNNLLAGSWQGSFSIRNDPNNPRIAINGTLTPGEPNLENGTPIDGRFTYTYHSGQVTVDIQGTIKYLETISGTDSLGFKGIRIDYQWRSGPNRGLGIWRSGLTEHRLDGTWGWSTSHNDGGRFVIERI
ncbi:MULTISPECIES: hypothetical protein [Salinirubellus]|uniref:hypothetical protein n=1 Tax=Salinirubellus TaxID=2162630 RepID=UPI0030CCEBF1